MEVEIYATNLANKIKCVSINALKQWRTCIDMSAESQNHEANRDS
jgi:hypothetical protein